MGLLCLKLRPHHSCLTSDILADQLACPDGIGIWLHLCIATHHDLAKRTVARLRLAFFNGNTEPRTWITSQVLPMTTFWPAGQVKDPLFPEEPYRKNAREPSRIKSRQMSWNRQIQ